MRRMAILACLWGAALVLPAGVTAQDDSKRPRRESTELFDQLDVNGDSTLSKDEVPERRQRLFARLLSGSDQDKDGKLSREEFARGLQEEPATPPIADQPSAERGERPAAGALGGGARPSIMAGVAVLRVLDADRDGKLSAVEIEGAAAALRRLDRNRDGQLVGDELNTPRTGRPSERSREGAPGGSGGALILERLREMDKNNDGRYTKDELPPRLQERFDGLDSNKDGSLDREELRSLGPRPGRGDGAAPRRGPPPRGRDRPPTDDAK